MHITEFEPKSVWKYFNEIAQIPHGSGNTKGISDYLVRFAKEHDLYYEQDAWNNIIMIREATPGYEAAAPLILQGHMDMVCEQTPDCTKDMQTEGLDLYVEGDFLHARDTTLGADDGIAVAYALALMEEEFVHPRLEVVLTVDEETGMDGALNIDPGSLKGRALINLDSEEEGVFIASCAGGERIDISRSFEVQAPEGDLLAIDFTGYRGGHSGQCINDGLQNANLSAARILYMAGKTVDFSLAYMAGGTKDNVIPNRCEVIVYTADKEGLKAALLDAAETVRHEFRATDGGFTLLFAEEVPEERLTGKVLTPASQKLLMSLLLALPNGVHAMSHEVKDLVETSSNLGIFCLKGEALLMGISCRSMRMTALRYTVERIRMYLESLGCETRTHSGYNGWEYDPDSEIRKLFVDAYEELFGVKPEILNLHAGLECGEFARKLPGLDCFSMGPQMYDIHTPKERVSISSVENCWKLLHRGIEKYLKKSE